MIMSEFFRARDMEESSLSPEQQLAANQQLLNILPFVLGFGWIVMIPISYLFIAPIFSNDIVIRIGATIGIVIATGIVDVVFLKIMTGNVEKMKRELEGIVQESENDSGEQKLLSGENWIGPDGTESGPDVPEDWYITYNGPAPIVEDIYGENYGVDRGDGTVPIDYYIKKWGVPDGYGATDYEKQFKQSSTGSGKSSVYSPDVSILD